MKTRRSHLSIVVQLILLATISYADLIIEGANSQGTILYKLDDKIVIEEALLLKGMVSGKTKEIGQIEAALFQKNILSQFVKLEEPLPLISLTEVTSEIELTRRDLDSGNLTELESLEATYHLRQLEELQKGWVQAEKEVFQYLVRDKATLIRGAYQKGKVKNLLVAVQSMLEISKGPRQEISKKVQTIDTRVLCAPYGLRGYLPTRVSDGKPIGNSGGNLGINYETCEGFVNERKGDLICSVLSNPNGNFEFAPHRISDGKLIGLSQRGMGAFKSCIDVVRNSKNGLACGISFTEGITNHFLPFRISDGVLVAGQTNIGFSLESCFKVIEHSTAEHVCSRANKGDGTVIYKIETVSHIGNGWDNQSFDFCLKSINQLKTK